MKQLRQLYNSWGLLLIFFAVLLLASQSWVSYEDYQFYDLVEERLNQNERFSHSLSQQDSLLRAYSYQLDAQILWLDSIDNSLKHSSDYIHE